MWILFALTSAAILASRKIQEKQLVWEAWTSLGWMIRCWSALGAWAIWIIFSREYIGITDWRLWWIIAIIALVLYPLQMGLYFRAIHELPLSLFGMLAWVAPLASLIFSNILLHLPITLFGIIGIGLVILAISTLIYKHEHKEIHITSILIAIGSYTIMWFGSVLDKLALVYTDPYFYAFLNQSTSACILFITAMYFAKGWAKIEFFQKNRKLILFIGILQWVSWVLWIHAVSWAPNPGYTTALINTHAIITAAYWILVLKEKVTKRKIFVFLCMIWALISFAFA